MEDEFEREFADELSMIQEEGDQVSRKRHMEDSPLSFNFEDGSQQRLKIPRLNGDTGSLPSIPEDEDDFEGKEMSLRTDVESDDGFPEDHGLMHSQTIPSQSTRSASLFTGIANTDTVQVKEPWDDDVGDGVEDSGEVKQGCLVSKSRSQSHCVLRRAPLGSYITVTSCEGDRVYLRLKSRKTESNQSGSSYTQSGLQLLKVPFSELKDSVEEEKRRKLIERSNDLLQSLKSCNEELEGGSQLLFSDPGDSDKDIEEHLLWVEKYSPKHYTELLSDDGINRTLLSWLKLWDEVVFGRPIALRGRPTGGTNTKSGYNSDENASIKKPQGKKFEKRMEYQDPTTFSGFEALDETGRPKIKLALLCGAPGLGKTTLAHIIARHAGYNVVEMNASDDRSPEAFTHKIESSTQMQAVLTPNTKPNCLIIDEIDGAPTAAINILIDLIKKKDTTAAKKKKSGPGLLSRPIICICNDQYAPSLRHLRQYSLLLYFPSTITARLASRLHQVVKREKMTAAMSTLMALCEKTDNDIRSCLNTLQFLSRKQKNISLALIQGANIGQKDAQRSLFSLWKEIFQLPQAKKHTLNQGPLKLAGALTEHSIARDGGMGANSTRFYNILSACIATGEHEKVANGLFENYLSVKFKDPNMEAITLGQDWMVFNDELQQQISRSQTFMFIGYLPFLSVAFHFLFAAPSKASIRYPNTNYEAFLQKQKSKHLLTTILAEVPPYMKRTITPTLLVIELLPPLTEILAPTFRPVSTQLYSSRERQQLVDLVGTMISYGLTFRQERGQDGQYTYVLEPNIEEVTRFSGLAQKKQLSYSTKQLIAREIEVEKLRRAEVFLTKRNESFNVHRKSTTEERVKCQPVQKEIKPKQEFPRIREEKEQVIDACVCPGDKYAVDFFGRRVSQSTCKKSGIKRSTSDSSALHSLWFKFNEGFSNAVRRPVRMKDLL